jgi:hypothetical protein
MVFTIPSRSIAIEIASIAWSWVQVPLILNGPSPIRWSSKVFTMPPSMVKADFGIGRKTVYPSSDLKSVYGADSVTWKVRSSRRLSPDRVRAEGFLPVPGLSASYPSMCEK